MPRASVLTVNRVGFLGGVERIILSAAPAARAAGLTPVLLCPAPGPLADAADGAGVVVRPAAMSRGRATTSPLGLLRLGFALKRGRREVLEAARHDGAALIHTHHPIGALQSLSAARTLGIPLLLHVHETLPMPRLYALALRHVAPACDLFVCVSEASARMVRSLGVESSRIRLIYNATAPKFIEPVAPASDIGGAGPHVGLFGVLEPRKGQTHFLHAAAQVAAAHPGATFWVVGPLSFSDHASYADGLRRLAAELGIADRVRFTGFRTDVPNLMAGMDVVVLASTGFESLPTVLIEAMALGRPVVATGVGGVEEIVRDNETGLIVAPGDPRALAQAILRLIAPEGAMLGAKGQADARIRFAPARFEKELAGCYTDLLFLGAQAVRSGEMARAA